MAGMLRVSRSRGALSGVLLVLLGIWGGLIPLVGPYVHYAYTPDHAWTFTSGRIWLEILPAAGTLLGGLILLGSKLRPMALFGACLAAASGAWFAAGSALAPLWTTATPAQGYPVGGRVAQVMEQIGFFTGLGVVIVCVASLALGRLSVVSVRDAALTRPVTTAEADAAADDAVAHDEAARDTAAMPITTGPATTDPVTPGMTRTSRWPTGATARMRRVATSDRTGTATADPAETNTAGEPIGTTSRP
ncbi:MAG TPA: hypothetical protein VF843_14635 [Streptosporangiaceae bacterium]